MSRSKIEFYKSYFSLAREIRDNWGLWGAEQSVPLPSMKQLISLLEAAYLAGMKTEEGRRLSFVVCCLPRSGEVVQDLPYDATESIDSWVFDRDRDLNIEELRRLSVSTDIDSSAIWVRFPEEPDGPMSIHGLLNLGSSYGKARKAFGYTYSPLPRALSIRVEFPGKLAIYKGNYPIALFQDGRIQIPLPIGELKGAHPIFSSGIDLISDEITRPKHDSSVGGVKFEWIAYINTILAILNVVHLGGHGGTLIIADRNCNFIKEGSVKIKYKFSLDPDFLRRCFIDFVNTRNQACSESVPEYYGNENIPTMKGIPLADTKEDLPDVETLLRRLIDNCHFVGKLSSTDGALIIRNDLSVEGFGAEILLDKTEPVEIYKTTSKGDKERFDSEEYGMRHRSAMRLCGATSALVAFVVSQDGGVSLVWNEDGKVLLQTGIRIENLDMQFF